MTGLCECGCGQATKIAPQSIARLGWKRGEPIRFVNGHNKTGKLAGETHPSFRGDDIGYSGLHRWLRDHYPKTGTCEECGATGRTDYASINGHTYTRNRSDYAELCVSCHMRHDYREGRRRPRGPDKRPRKRAHGSYAE